MKSRNSGLDLFRTLAILLVLISHTRHFFTYLHFEHFNIWYLSIGGYLGVELFFVLSGFLIGEQLYKYVINNPNHFYNLKIFYFRRWYRTLPLYYLFMIIYIVIFYINTHQINFPYLHLVFLQNFDKEAIRFFPVAWSLSVEEWFYLIIPILLLFSFYYSKVKFIPLISVFIFISFIKVYIVLKHPELTWTDIRKNIFLRFDSMIVGVFFAYLKIYKYHIFEKFKSKKIFFINLFLLLLLSIWYWYNLQPGLDKSFFSKAFMFQLTSLILAPIMIYLYFNFKLNLKVFYYGSIYSYSIYLMHFIFLIPFIHIAHKYKDLTVSFILLVVFYILNIFFAYLLYRFFESNILQKRPKYLI